MQEDPNNFVDQNYTEDETFREAKIGKKAIVKGYEYNVSFKDLILEGAEKYNEQLDKENSSKPLKYSKVAIESIYSVGIIPLM